MNTIKKSTEMVTVGKEIKKMEKALESMKKNAGVSAEAIAQQETALNEKKQNYEKLNKQAQAEQGVFDKDQFLTFAIIVNFRLMNFSFLSRMIFYILI